MTSPWSFPKINLAVVFLSASLLAAQAFGQPHKLVEAQDGSGIPGYKHTPIQPWSGYHVHDPDRPAPPVVTAGEPGTQAAAGTAPSDAVVLFDGGDLAKWQPSQWKVVDNCMVATEGLLLSRQEFGDCQLHMEWSAPEQREANSMNQGNNGVQLLGGVEVQIFDSHRVKLYPDGQAAAIYAQTPPLVNASRAPGQWQSYDIVLLAPASTNLDR